MEEVDDDDRYRYAPAPVLARYTEQFLLGLVAQLALP